MNRHFSKEGIHAANKSMTKSLVSLIIREMHIKTTMRNHVMPVRMAVIKTGTTDASKVAEKKETSTLLATMQINSTVVEDDVVISQRSRSRNAI